MAKKGLKKSKLALSTAETQRSFSIGEKTPEEISSVNSPIDDNRPTISPYTESALTFEIGPNRVAYSVPRIYAEQSPQWTFPPDPYNQYNPQTVELHNVDEDIGHTLVHYLYTGTYQTLKLQDVSDVSESTTEYKRACLVYCTARLYRLDSLADYAVQNMELFEKGLSLFQILDMARDVYSELLEDEIWFLDYLKMKIEAAFEADETIFAQEHFLNYLGDATTFSRALVKRMVGILTDKITSIAKKEVTEEFAPVEAPKECALPPQHPEYVFENPPPLPPSPPQHPEDAFEDVPPPPSPPTPPPEEPELRSSGSGDSWGNFSFLPSKKGKKGKKETKIAFEEEAEPVPQAIKSWGWATMTEEREETKTVYEEEAEPIPQVDESDSAPAKKGKKGKKGKKAIYEEEAEPVPQANGVWDWARIAVEKEETKTEEAEPVAQADDSEWAPTKKGKKGKKEKKPIYEEPELASLEPSVLVVAPSLEPDVEQSNVCSFQAQHILNGDGWQSCKKCRTVICQMSIQLLHGGDMDGSV